MQHQKETKKAAAHIRNSGLRPEIFVRESVHPRASAENPVLSQATVVSPYPVGRPTLSRQTFLMLAANKTISVWYSKPECCKQIGDSLHATNWLDESARFFEISSGTDFNFRYGCLALVT